VDQVKIYFSVFFFTYNGILQNRKGEWIMKIKKEDAIMCIKGCGRIARKEYQGDYYCPECYEKILEALDREKEAEYESEEEELEL